MSDQQKVEIQPIEKPSTISVLQNMLNEIAYLQSNGTSDMQGYVFSVRAQLQQCLRTAEKK